MKILQKFIIIIGLLIIPSYSLADINVLTSIQPLHSLVSKIMDGVGEPSLILDRTASPHRYSLTPRNAKDIENADVIFWFGPYIETFLTKPIKNISGENKSIQISKIKGLIKYSIREGGGFERHDHDHHHNHDDHDDEKSHKSHDDDHDDHDDKSHKSHDDDHDDHDDDKSHKSHDDHKDSLGEFDQHVWLDPENAKIILNEIKNTLSNIDPSNSSRYEKNYIIAKNDIDSLIKITKIKLQNYGDDGFIYFHDAYQYFEKRFGLKASGTITVSPDLMPGAKRLKELKKIINKSNVKCVFSEPQFESKIINTIVDGTGKKASVLDPLGFNIMPGKKLYNQLIINMSDAFVKCFDE